MPFNDIIKVCIYVITLMGYHSWFCFVLTVLSNQNVWNKSFNSISFCYYNDDDHDLGAALAQSVVPGFGNCRITGLSPAPTTAECAPVPQ